MFKRSCSPASWPDNDSDVLSGGSPQTESSSSRAVPEKRNSTTRTDTAETESTRTNLQDLEQSVLDDTFFFKSLDSIRKELESLSSEERAATDAGVRSRRSGTNMDLTDDSLQPSEAAPAELYDDVRWALGLLLIPSLRNLPRDTNDLAIIPHSHPMIPQQARESSYAYLHRFAVWGYKTDKVCDNCQRDIHEQSWFHCSRDCDIDFCTVCDASLRRALDHCRTASGCNDSHETVAAKCRDYVRVVEDAVFCLMNSTRSVRREISHVLQNVETETFTAIVVCIRDYLNAKVVHVQDVKDIGSDVTFWYLMAFMQMLQQISSKRRDCTETFTLMGINKCEPLSELCRWKKKQHQRGVPSIEDVEDMKLEVESIDFCCFLTHRNLLPAAFLRTVVFYDAWGVLLQRQSDHRDEENCELRRMEIEVSRRPEETVLAECIDMFGTENLDSIRRPLVIRFRDEVAEGPGVNREYLQLALTTLVQNTVFEYMETSRCYFFRPQTEGMSSSDTKICLAFGRLLAHIVLNKVFLQPAFENLYDAANVGDVSDKAFPTIFFAKLCHGLKNAVPRYSIEDLREFDPQAATSLRAILDHEGDVAELGIEGLDNDRKAYVRKYLIRRFETDVAEPSAAMMEGFRSILGDSEVLQTLNPFQLKRILCGGEEYCVDITALKQSARCEGFESEDTYLEEFWALLEEWEEPMKRKFIRFVTAGDRAPLKGWCDIQLNIHKNGSEPTDKLPTAYTCYNMLLLPHYENKAKLENRLLAAINWAEGFGLQ